MPVCRVGRVGVGSLCAVAVLVGVGSAASAAGQAPTGSTATIAFYRAVVAATQGTAGVEEDQTGYSFIAESVSASSTFSMISAVRVAPAGYSRAVEHITIANEDGHVGWVSDDLVPVSCNQTPGSGCLPVAVLLTSSGVVWHFGSANFRASGSCWGVMTDGAVDGYTNAGGPFGYDLYGHFDPMRRVGGTDLVTSTYPWGKAQATEVDTVRATTHLPTAGVVHISASPGYPAFSYRWSDHWLTTALPVPHVTLCT